MNDQNATRMTNAEKACIIMEFMLDTLKFMQAIIPCMLCGLFMQNANMYSSLEKSYYLIEMESEYK